MKHTVDAMGKQCPIPVVMTKKILDKAEQGDEIQVLVDNETAVNNLSRLAGSTGCSFVSRKTEDGYEIHMVVKSDVQARTAAEPEIVCTPAVPQGDYTVAITSDKMGDGDPELGAILIKGFVYALTQLETPPAFLLKDSCMLFPRWRLIQIPSSFIMEGRSLLLRIPHALKI